jgi:hypothetical protein
LLLVRRHDLQLYGLDGRGRHGRILLAPDMFPCAQGHVSLVFAWDDLYRHLSLVH